MSRSGEEEKREDEERQEEVEKRSRYLCVWLEPWSRVPEREPRSARWIRLLDGVVEKREGFREEGRAHERMKGHPRGPPACSV